MSTHYLKSVERADQETKRRKIEQSFIERRVHTMYDRRSTITANGARLNNNGTVTPIQTESNKDVADNIPNVCSSAAKDNSGNKDDDIMDTRKDECPCGYLHGPGQGQHEDITAVGLSSQPLLRGPD